MLQTLRKGNENEAAQDFIPDSMTPSFKNIEINDRNC